MKKTVVLTITMLFSILFLSAQNEDIKIEHARIGTGMPVKLFFGPRIGINYSNITSSEMSGVNGIVGVVAGGFAEIQFAKWFSLSLDILYSSQGYAYKDQKYVNSNIIVPVLANFYVVGDLALKIGVQPGMLIYSQKIAEQQINTATDDFRRFTLDIPVGISYPLWERFQIDLRYNIGLLNISNSDQYKLSNSTVSLSVGLKF